MYAGDYDDTLPRHDNNGSCLYGESPCNTPDCGVFTPPSNDTSAAGYNKGKPVMYWGAIEPYHKNQQISVCPTIGKSNWSAIMSQGTQVGLVTVPYNSQNEAYYNDTLGQMALNLYLIDWGYPGTWLNNRPGAAKGRLGMVNRPGEVFMLVAESTWGWGQELGWGLGNGAVWPSWGANVNCMDYSNVGWTRYVHMGKTGTYSAAHYPNGPVNNPNLQGLAVFGFVDGHCKAMRYPEAEKCVATPAGTVFNSGAGSYAYYYPYWTPEIQ